MAVSEVGRWEDTAAAATATAAACLGLNLRMTSLSIAGTSGRPPSAAEGSAAEGSAAEGSAAEGSDERIDWEEAAPPAAAAALAAIGDAEGPGSEESVVVELLGLLPTFFPLLPT